MSDWLEYAKQNLLNGTVEEFAEAETALYTLAAAQALIDIAESLRIMREVHLPTNRRQGLG